jgi:ribosomal protein S18 acetylase RimI-like enzyme
MTIILRPEAPEDERFLRGLITGIIAGELGAGAWPESVREHLLGIQYTTRRQSCGTGRPGAESHVIQADGQDCGWLLVVTMPHEVRLVEIMVSPMFRGQGIGTFVIRQVLARAAAAGVPVRLNVNVWNTNAARLYLRLGFHRIDGNEVQDLMECWAE